jgi:hypothetical protein
MLAKHRIPDRRTCQYIDASFPSRLLLLRFGAVRLSLSFASFQQSSMLYVAFLSQSLVDVALHVSFLCRRDVTLASTNVVKSLLHYYLKARRFAASALRVVSDGRAPLRLGLSYLEPFSPFPRMDREINGKRFCKPTLYRRLLLMP